MENIGNTDPSRTEEGKQVTEGTPAPPPDEGHVVENSDEIVGDVHPTERSDTFQEEMNAGIENQSDSSKISGESL